MRNQIQDCHGKSRIQQEDTFHQHIVLEVKEKVVKCYIWSIALYTAETQTLLKVDQKYLESFEVMVVEKDGQDQLG
jgi:hypothetical protein